LDPCAIVADKVAAAGIEGIVPVWIVLKVAGADVPIAFVAVSWNV
jgi:hypothetical protein